MSGPASITRAVLRSPWTAAVLGVALGLDAAAQPGSTFAGGSLRTYCFFPRELSVIRTEAGAIKVQGWDDGDGGPANVWADHRIHRIGIWAPTSAVINTNLHFDDSEFESSLSPAERTEVRLQYADRLAEVGMPRQLITALRAGETVTTTTISAGYIHDAVVIIAAAFFLHALCFVPMHISAFASRARRMRAALAGSCPNCGYDLSGLSQRVCPECGHDSTDHDEHYF